MQPQVPNKRVVVVYWKNKPENPIEVFTSLKNFCLSYTIYNYNTLSNYLSKGKVAYENAVVRIERKIVYTKPKETSERKIQPVVRHVLMRDADDYTRDLTYWLSRPEAERLRAVTLLIRQTLSKGQKMDKTKFARLKSKE